MHRSRAIKARPRGITASTAATPLWVSDEQWPELVHPFASAEGDAGAAVARSRDRTLVPSAAPFRRKCRAPQFLDIAVAQGEAEIKPDRVLDDLGRGAMAAVAERSHADILPDTPLAPDPVSVTMPTGQLAAPPQVLGDHAGSVARLRRRPHNRAVGARRTPSCPR